MANLTSSQVGPQVKNNPRKQVRWTENMDQVLINGLLEIVLAGPKRTENGFKGEEFKKVIDKVREACHVSVSLDNVRGRLRTLKKECDDITELFKISGFGLDSSGRVSADPITWETYIKEKPEGTKMKGKLCPRYYDLLTVFGNDAATGDRAISGNDFPPISEPVDDLEDENDVEEIQPSHSTNSHRSVQGGPSQRRKHTKPMEDAPLALAKIAKSSEMIAIAFDKQASQNYVNGQALLEKLKEMDIDQGDILDLMQVFEGDEKAGIFFLEITDVEFRRLWVYRGRKVNEQNGNGEKKENAPMASESRSSKKKAKKDKSSKEAKDSEEQQQQNGSHTSPDDANSTEDASAVDVKGRLKKAVSTKKKKSSKEVDAAARSAARNAKLAAAKKKEKNHYNQQLVR